MVPIKQLDPCGYSKEGYILPPWASKPLAPYTPYTGIDLRRKYSDIKYYARYNSDSNDTSRNWDQLYKDIEAKRLYKEGDDASNFYIIG